MTRYSSILYTPTISGSSAVAAGQVLSATEAIGSSEGGYLDSVQLYKLDDVTRGIVLYIFGANVAVGVESAAFSPADASADDLLTVITFSSGGDVDLTNSLFQMKSVAEGDVGLGTWLQGTTQATDAALYAAITTASTGTHTTGSMKLRFNFRHE